MSSPQRFINRMIVFLVVPRRGGTAYEILFRIYMYNPLLNGLILGVLLIGIVYIFRRVFVLRPEIRWIEAFRTSKPGFSLQAAPRLLAPVAAALGEQERRGASCCRRCRRAICSTASAPGSTKAATSRAIRSAC